MILGTSVNGTTSLPGYSPNYASNMKNVLNMCTLREVLRPGNGCPGLHEVFFGFIFLSFREYLILFKSLRIRKKEKQCHKNLSRFKTSERNIQLYRPTATRMGTWMVSIDTSHSLILTWKIIQEKREKYFQCNSIYWRQEWWVNRVVLTRLRSSRFLSCSKRFRTGGKLQDKNCKRVRKIGSRGGGEAHHPLPLVVRPLPTSRQCFAYPRRAHPFLAWSISNKGKKTAATRAKF